MCDAVNGIMMEFMLNNILLAIELRSILIIAHTLCAQRYTV